MQISASKELIAQICKTGSSRKAVAQGEGLSVYLLSVNLHSQGLDLLHTLLEFKQDMNSLPAIHCCGVVPCITATTGVFDGKP